MNGAFEMRGEDNLRWSRANLDRRRATEKEWWGIDAYDRAYSASNSCRTRVYFCSAFWRFTAKSVELRRRAALRLQRAIRCRPNRSPREWSKAVRCPGTGPGSGAAISWPGVYGGSPSPLRGTTVRSVYQTPLPPRLYRLGDLQHSFVD